MKANTTSQPLVDTNNTIHMSDERLILKKHEDNSAAEDNQRPETEQRIIEDAGQTATSKLTNAEADQLQTAEQTISRGLDTFIEVGTSLAIVRDNALYRDQYNTFEDYVAGRWKFTKQRASQLITAAEFRTTLANRNPKALRLTTERATRELMKVPDDHVAAVLEAVLLKGEPTAESIASARQELVPKKNTEPKKKSAPKIKIETALKSMKKWITYLSHCDIKNLAAHQAQSLKEMNSMATDAFAKVMREA